MPTRGRAAFDGNGRALKRPPVVLRRLRSDTPHREGETRNPTRSSPRLREKLFQSSRKISRKKYRRGFDSPPTTGFTNTDGAGNAVKCGTLQRDHRGNDKCDFNDINARKSRFGIAARMVRESKPVPSKNVNKPNERGYFGLDDGKAYIAAADEHNEIGAMEIASYRRDGRTADCNFWLETPLTGGGEF